MKISKISAISQDKLTEYCGPKKIQKLKTKVVFIAGDPDEIIELGKFLTQVGKDMKKWKDISDHRHFRDTFRNWNKKSVDFVVVKKLG